jgi:lysophospholipase L1-like esterase
MRHAFSSLGALIAMATALVSMPVAAGSYLALGDSYTIGEAVAAEARWPVLLAEQLRAEGIVLEGPEIIARTGWTTDELSAAIDAAAPAGERALVTLLIGVNNQYRGRSAEQYRGEFAALLSRAIGFAHGVAGRVVVVSIPDWGATPFAAASGRDRRRIASEIDAFNAVARAECERRSVAFVDITPISRAPDPEAKLIAGDGLHPSAAQYRLWVERALPVVRARLTEHR